MFEINNNEYSQKVVTKEFLSFFETFHVEFEEKRQELLLSRIKTQEFQIMVVNFHFQMIGL